MRNVSGEEASRALLLLKSPLKEVKAAQERARQGLSVALERARLANRGFFCCGTCDPALWRHISAGGLKGEDDWHDTGVRTLKANRDASGKWRRFQFFYTLLALSEMDFPAATAEMTYAAPVCERYLKRAPRVGITSERRSAVVERVLARC